MKIAILGTGCANCKRLESNAKKAVEELGQTAEIVKVTDIKDIMGYGVMGTPALVIDDKVVCAGRVPNVQEIKKWLQ
jgi:small redox-active disulfide protein 2